MGDLDAAEAELLNLAPPGYVLGQMPSLLAHAQRHLVPNDPRRLKMERLGRLLGDADSGHPLLASGWTASAAPTRPSRF